MDEFATTAKGSKLVESFHARTDTNTRSLTHCEKLLNKANVDVSRFHVLQCLHSYVTRFNFAAAV